MGCRALEAKVSVFVFTPPDRAVTHLEGGWCIHSQRPQGRTWLENSALGPPLPRTEPRPAPPHPDREC